MNITKEDVINDINNLKIRVSFFESLIPYDVEQSFSKYGYIYPFTNEKLKIIFKYLDLSNRILTVTSSGDQSLFAILNGATKIDCFDKNKLAKYFSELKIAAIKSLSYKQFKKFYKINDLNPINIKKNLNFLQNINITYFDKILLNMPDLYAYFFELFYDFIRSINTKVAVLINYNFIPAYSGYLQKEKYYELKDKLKNVENINYYDCDIFDLKKHIGNKKYSSMVFSNITSYFDEEKLNRMLILLDKIKVNLEPDSLVQFGYGSAIPGLQILGKNRVNKEFVDAHGNVLFDIEEEDKILTLYKNL